VSMWHLKNNPKRRVMIWGSARFPAPKFLINASPFTVGALIFYARPFALPLNRQKTTCVRLLLEIKFNILIKRCNTETLFSSP